jgi:hypothetical protein
MRLGLERERANGEFWGGGRHRVFESGQPELGDGSQEKRGSQSPLRLTAWFTAES